MSPKRFLRSDDGFTLVELLLAMVVLGTIVAAVGSAIIVVLRNESAVSDRTGLAHDQALMSVYVVPDIQSALSVTASSGTGCASGPDLLTLSWSETLASTTSYSSDYRVVAQGGAWVLTRTFSTNGVAQAPQIIAHNLSSSSAARVSCSAGNRAVAMTITEPGGVATVTSARRGP